MPLKESINLQTFESLEALEGIRREWELLSEGYPYSTTFSTWEWLAPWWRAFGAQDRLLALAGYSGDCLVGLATLALSRQRAFGTDLNFVRLVGDGTPDSDNLDIPAFPGHEVAFSQTVLGWLESHSQDWDVCQFRTLPSQSPVGHCILESLKNQGWIPYISTRPQSVIELPETWEQYGKMLSAKERGKIGLRFRKLDKKYKTEIRKCSEESELDTSLAALFELHGKHWKQRGLAGSFDIKERRQFYRELSSGLLKKNLLEFWLLKLDEQIVAAQYGFRLGKTVFSLQEGFDPAFSADSVGFVLRSQVLKALIESGVRAYDFLAGTNESKMRWGATLKSYVDIEFARPSTMGSAYLRLKTKTVETKEWLRMRLPGPVLRTWERLAQGSLTD